MWTSQCQVNEWFANLSRWSNGVVNRRLYAVIMALNISAKCWLTGRITTALPWCISNPVSRHKMLTLNDLTEQCVTNGLRNTYLKRLNKPNTWQQNGFGHTITNDLILQLVEYRQGIYWTRLNPLLLTAFINGEITVLRDLLINASMPPCSTSSW